MAADNQDALLIFPAEAWERILDSMNNGESVHNVLSVFPELGVRFHQKKTLWLFDQVCPHLFKTVDEDDKPSFIGICRQTCKRWCLATDTFIQNHASRRVYNTNNITRRTVPYGQFSYDHWWHIGLNLCLETVNEIHSFIDELADHTNPGNPLKSIEICLVSRGVDKPENFLGAVLAFLEEFGANIWNINLVLPTFYIRNVKAAHRVLLSILRCLVFLPNARKINLGFQLDAHIPLLNIHNWFTIKLANQVPPRPHLETLELIENCPDFVQLALLQHFKLQIKKLKINNDNICYTVTLRDVLVELEVNFDESTFKAGIVAPLVHRFPHLKKLTLSVDSAVGGPRIEITVTGLYWILIETKIEELNLETCRIIPDCACFLQDMDTFPTVKYVKLTDHPDQELHFLTAFPSLDHLEIFRAEDVSAAAESSKSHQLPDNGLPWRYVNPLTVAVRMYLYGVTVPESVSVWDKIASLQLLTVADKSDSFEATFARECGNKPFILCVETTAEAEAAGESRDDDEDDNKGVGLPSPRVGRRYSG